MPSVRLLTDMMPAPSSQSSGSISLARRPPRSTSEYLNFYVDDLSSWDGMERQTLRAATPLIPFSGSVISAV